MDITVLKEIVDDLYADFDWYSGEFSKADSKRFKAYLDELNKEARELRITNSKKLKAKK